MSEMQIQLISSFLIEHYLYVKTRLKTTINMNTVLLKVKQWYLMLHPGDYIMAEKKQR